MGFGRIEVGLAEAVRYRGIGRVMERIAGRSGATGGEKEEIGAESFFFGEEIQTLMTGPPENGSSFTALLGLPANQAMELLHSPESDTAPAELSGEAWKDNNMNPHKPYYCSPTFPSNAALIERAARFSIFAAGENSPETSSVPSNSSYKVKNEPTDTDSNPNSLPPLISNPTVENKNQRSTKRKEREKKVGARQIRVCRVSNFGNHLNICD